MTTRLPVFVYGTLRSGEGNWRWALAGRTVSETPAVLDGAAMYDQGGFPFVARSETGRVIGDLMVIEDTCYDEVLSALDSLEGYRGPGQSNMYDRETVTVTTADGIQVQAYTYVVSPRLFEDRVCRLPRIENGDWIAHDSNRPPRHAWARV